MAFDEGRGKMVMFGPTSSGSETWEYDGALWTQVDTNTQPFAREDAVLAYDSARKVMVLLAGTEQWEWNGTQWSLAAAPAPSVGVGSAMVYDPVIQRLFLVGGSGAFVPRDNH